MSRQNPLETQIIDQSKKIKELEEKLPQLLNDLQLQLNNLKQKVAERKMEHGSLSTQLLESKKSTHWLQKLSDGLVKQRLEYQGIISWNKFELQQLGEKLNDAMQLFQKIEGDLGAAWLTLQAEKDKSRAWEATIHDQSLHLEKLNKQSLERQSVLQGIEQEIKSLEQERKSIEYDLSRRLEKNQEISSSTAMQLVSKEKTNNLIQDEINQQLDQIDSLRTHNDKLKNLVTEKDSRIDILKYESKQQGLLAKQSKILKDENELLTKENEGLEQKIMELTLQKQKSQQLINSLLPSNKGSNRQKEKSPLVKNTILKTSRNTSDSNRQDTNINYSKS